MLLVVGVACGGTDDDAAGLDDTVQATVAAEVTFDPPFLPTASPSPISATPTPMSPPSDPTVTPLPSGPTPSLTPTPLPHGPTATPDPVLDGYLALATDHSTRSLDLIGRINEQLDAVGLDRNLDWAASTAELRDEVADLVLDWSEIEPAPGFEEYHRLFQQIHEAVVEYLTVFADFGTVFIVGSSGVEAVDAMERSQRLAQDAMTTFEASLGDSRGVPATP